jgi:hypothetical protein
MLVHEMRTTVAHAVLQAPLSGAAAALLGGTPKDFTHPLKEAT